MKTKWFSMAVMVLAVSAGSLADTYDLNADFDYATNPNGVWTFGYSQGSDLVPYDISAPNIAGLTGVNALHGYKADVWCPTDYYGTVCKNTNSTDVVMSEWPNQMRWFAGKTHLMTPVSVALDYWAFTVARFVAPADGLYDINVDFLKASIADVVVDVQVNVNGTTVLLQRISNGDPDASYDAMGVSLVAGQTIDLMTIPVAGSGTANGGFIITQVDAVITQVPEPATMGLLAIGGLGVLLRRKNK